MASTWRRKAERDADATGSVSESGIRGIGGRKPARRALVAAVVEGKAERVRIGDVTRALTRAGFVALAFVGDARPSGVSPDVVVAFDELDSAWSAGAPVVHAPPGARPEGVVGDVLRALASARRA